MDLRSIYNIGIEPKDKQQYINTIKNGNVELIVNTSIENGEDVQRIGVVVSLPLIYNGELKIGDEVVVHHNVFRITYNDQGVPMQSTFHFKDDLFFIPEDMIYLKIRKGKVSSYNDNVFVEPIMYEDYWEGQKLVERQGYIKFSNDKLNNIGIKDGDKIVFRKFCEYKFNIFGLELYKMKDTRILAKLN